MVETADILDFWFDECNPEQWFKKNDEFDKLLDSRFGSTVEDALSGRLDGWEETEEGCLALILVLDQFTRNIYRDTPRAFSGDKKALELSQKCCDNGHLANPDLHRREFILMPMMHSEDIAVQEASLPLFKELGSVEGYEYAVKHRDVIAHFGRFPHRNVVLGRQSTNEELEFLKQPGSSF
jgi:uncharacterized protein (DUF924 family)